jgi:hypothetical protein
METFLNDYGLVWVGGSANDEENGLELDNEDDDNELDNQATNNPVHNQNQYEVIETKEDDQNDGEFKLDMERIRRTVSELSIILSYVF